MAGRKGQIAGAESQLREVEQQIEREKRIRLLPAYFEPEQQQG